MPDRPSVSLVIPAYNERATIADVMERSIAVLERCTPDHELIVLDDASSDETFEIMKGVQRAHAGAAIRVARHPINRGIAVTFEDLYRMATKEFVFLIAGDGQYPPETLVACMPLLGAYDIVICRRVLKQYTPYRHALSFLYRWLPRLLFGVDTFDAGGIKCVRREIIQKIPVESMGVFVEAERVIRAVKRGYKLTTVDMTPVERQGGQARGARLSSVLGAGTDMLRCWWRLVVLRRPS
jgi:glycosyltransferase involved in cell wall biosynthesis